MPKHYTFPTLYNEVLQISISKLKEWKYLNPKQIKNGTITWNRNGNQTSSISIMVNTHSEQPYIELDYKYRDEPRNYKVRLVSIPSNLGKGKIWYFLCPQSNKRCRKLYLVGGYFFHREAFNNGMYESQTQSKTYRQLSKTFKSYFEIDELYSQIYQKHFKKTYAGKPTKRFLKILNKINQCENIELDEVKRLIL